MKEIEQGVLGTGGDDAVALRQPRGDLDAHTRVFEGVAVQLGQRPNEIVLANLEIREDGEPAPDLRAVDLDPRRDGRVPRQRQAVNAATVVSVDLRKILRLVGVQETSP